MTTVVCSLGPVNRIADAAAPIGDAVVAALGAWVASPGELTASSTMRPSVALATAQTPVRSKPISTVVQ